MSDTICLHFPVSCFLGTVGCWGGRIGLTPTPVPPLPIWRRPWRPPGIGFGQAASKQDTRAGWVQGSLRACWRGWNLPLTTPPTLTHAQTQASYRDGVFNFFGIAIGRWPHETHNQSFKLPCQLILQVCNEVLVAGQREEEMEEQL